MLAEFLHFQLIFYLVCFTLQMLNSSSKEKYPLFTFVKGHSRDYDFASSPLHEEHDLFSEDEKKRLKRFSTEEFVLL